MGKFLEGAFIVCVVYPISSWLEHPALLMLITALASVPAFVSKESSLRPWLKVFFVAWLSLFVVFSAAFMIRPALRVFHGQPLF